MTELINEVAKQVGKRVACDALGVPRGSYYRGYVVRNEDGTPVVDGQVKWPIWRVRRQAGLPERRWHCLRHSFGTHAAMFGVNPWTLMNWLGHKSIEQTMRYVHYAKAHLRPLPQPVIEASMGEPDPDRRIINMLSARTPFAVSNGRQVGDNQLTIV